MFAFLTSIDALPKNLGRTPLRAFSVAACDGVPSSFGTVSTKSPLYPVPGVTTDTLVMTPNACDEVSVDTLSSTGCCTVPPNKGPSKVSVSPPKYPDPPFSMRSTDSVPTPSVVNLIVAPRPAPVVVDGATSKVEFAVYDSGVWLRLLTVSMIPPVVTSATV